MKEFVIELDLSKPEILKQAMKVQMSICIVSARLSAEQIKEARELLEDFTGAEVFETWLRVFAMLYRHDPYTPSFPKESRHRKVLDAAFDIYRRYCSPTPRKPQEIAERYMAFMDQLLDDLEIELFGSLIENRPQNH